MLKSSDIPVWENYLLDIGIDSAIVAEYSEYLENCNLKKIPPIFEQNHLALLLGLELEDMLSMVWGTESFYRTFKIRKRSGGSRQLSAPYPSLLKAQQWINDNILQTRELPNCVTGFRSGYSILDNARMHAGRDKLVKLDIENFFPSIDFRRVMFIFRQLGYSVKVSFLLSKLCTLNNKLPQGAATSPALSNIICSKMDKRFYGLCKKNRLRYTRYADDIAISGKSISDGLSRMFFEIVESEGFKINAKKVRFLDAGDRKIVTGIDISSGELRVTRKFRRELQRDVYFVWSAGLATHLSRKRIFNPRYIESLLGRASFWKSVEPENPQIQKILERLRQVIVLHSERVQ